MQRLLAWSVCIFWLTRKLSPDIMSDITFLKLVPSDIAIFLFKTHFLDRKILHTDNKALVSNLNKTKIIKITIYYGADQTHRFYIPQQTLFNVKIVTYMVITLQQLILFLTNSEPGFVFSPKNTVNTRFLFQIFLMILELKLNA